MMKKETSINEAVRSSINTLSIQQMSSIKGGSGDCTEQAEDEKRRKRPGDGGVSTQRPNR
jgi:hypothetical protein